MTEHEVTVSHGMRVIRDGASQAPPVLLIHGSGSSAGSWEPVVPTLAAKHRVIRVDLPGHGRSPAGGTYRVPEQAGQVAALLDELGLTGVPVAGHSSGGYIATSLVEQRPDLVSALALVSTGPIPEAVSPQPFIVRALSSAPLGPILFGLRNSAVVRKGVEAVCHRPVDLPDTLIEEVRGISYRTFHTVLRRNTEYLAERGMPDRLAPLRMPTLVVFGAADPRWEPSSAHLYEALPGTRVEFLPDVGHLPMYEEPARTGALLRDFLAARS